MGPNFLLTMALTGEKETPITTANLTELTLTEHVNNIAKGLAVVRFRGTVQFIIYEKSVPKWTSFISFTDDIPNGTWSNSRD